MNGRVNDVEWPKDEDYVPDGDDPTPFDEEYYREHVEDDYRDMDDEDDDPDDDPEDGCGGAHGIAAG